MNDPAQTIRGLLETEPLEDAVEAFRILRDELAGNPRELAELEVEIYERVFAQQDWIDPIKGSEALRFCLEIAYDHQFVDGDTTTYLLVRAVEQAPHDDVLVAEYIAAVADTDYRFTDLNLLEIAQKLADEKRARRLGLLDTLCEFMVLRSYLEPPTEVYVAAMKQSFAAAIELGGDESAWLSAHQWVADKVPYANVPADLFSRFVD